MCTMGNDLRMMVGELDRLSPTFQLMQQMINEAPIDSLQRDMKHFKSLRDSLSAFPYETYRRDAKNAHEMVKRIRKDLNIPSSDFKSITESLEQMRIPTPIELMTSVTIPKPIFTQINTELYDTDWNNIKENSAISKIDYPTIEFATKEPEKFASKLYNHIKGLDDDELTSVFTEEFLNEITKNWWIFPRFSFEDYKEFSELGFDDCDLNRYVLLEYVKTPELIYDLINNWEFHDNTRFRVIMQATNNYYEGNYEICVLTLLLQIEGLMRDKFEIRASSPDLRKKLNKRLNTFLKENSENLTSWDEFLIKSSMSYVWMILKPLCDKVDLIEEEYEINRHVSAHNGKVEADQIAAIRLYLIIDTLMYLLELI